MTLVGLAPRMVVLPALRGMALVGVRAWRSGGTGRPAWLMTISKARKVVRSLATTGEHVPTNHQMGWGRLI